MDTPPIYRPRRQKNRGEHAWKGKRKNEPPPIFLHPSFSARARGESGAGWTYLSLARSGRINWWGTGWIKHAGKDAARRCWTHEFIPRAGLRGRGLICAWLALYRGTIDTCRQHHQLAAPRTKPTNPFHLQTANYLVFAALSLSLSLVASRSTYFNERWLLVSPNICWIIEFNGTKKNFHFLIFRILFELITLHIISLIFCNVCC